MALLRHIRCLRGCHSPLAAAAALAGRIGQSSASVAQARSYATPAQKKAKSQPDSEPRILLGRPGNNLKMGIVGLPNIGKSSFFNSLTNSAVPSENYPFCTIDPSESRVIVPDERFDWLCNHYKTRSAVPASLTVTDIAGLVKGAHEGAGLGNAFLSNIQAVDGIFHLCRGFEDKDITHVEGNVDPVRDLMIIHDELRLKDEAQIEKLLEARKKDIAKYGRNMAKEKLEEYDVLSKLWDVLSVQQRDVRDHEWSNPETKIINGLYLLTAKPVVYLCNLSERDYATRDDRYLSAIRKWVDENHPGDGVIGYSNDVEYTLSASETDEERAEYLAEVQNKYGISEPVTSAFKDIINSGYNALSLFYFFTAGEQEVRAWTIRKGTKAPQAAGVIHSDFEKSFVTAETMKFEDLKALGSEDSVKAAGKYAQKGRDYVVEDGDIFHFKVGKRK
ncbi:P-loop containing nucleoside triphosphate hydrolase protein [Polychytrium aggregatum]|uniref:P-loop containing nucleoside triphosphate hydrolase protein n=1 Tax=Polychytrium aggregatum TaxID=110093 RepID=UPI0022FE2D6A|nr:P-loop containing nucleoside triphosphate hydrolase protein [Polychytrium aggregatum]KAI9206769.1 P-loop containing nucleoside triphosphate hydrolase protein [Polychytrium aggregatum]